MGSIPDEASFFFSSPLFSSSFFFLPSFFSTWYVIFFSPSFFSPSFFLLPFFLSPPLFPRPFSSPLYARSAISMLKHFSSYSSTDIPANLNSHQLSVASLAQPIIRATSRSKVIVFATSAMIVLKTAGK